jgi:hypothetical protein
MLLTSPYLLPVDFWKYHIMCLDLPTVKLLEIAQSRHTKDHSNAIRCVISVDATDQSTESPIFDAPFWSENGVSCPHERNKIGDSVLCYRRRQLAPYLERISISTNSNHESMLKCLSMEIVEKGGLVTDDWDAMIFCNNYAG